MFSVKIVATYEKLFGLYMAMGNDYHPKFQFLFTALLEIKFKLVGKRNFISLEKVKLQEELLRELIIDFFPFGCLYKIPQSRYLFAYLYRLNAVSKDYKPVFRMNSTIILLWFGSPKRELQFPNCRNICHLYLAMNLNLSRHLLLLEVLECSFSN